jgi:methylated-DNA-[protein]-cysteine S-methyltransferase
MDTGIFAAESAFLGRYVQVGVASQRVVSVSVPDEPDDEADDDHPVLDRIGAYLDGAEEEFGDVEVGLTVPTDRRAVLEATREIPYGEEVTVEGLAGMAPGLDPEGDTDVVRTALAENPVPLVIPDHRVADTRGGAPRAVEGRLRSLEGL